MAEAQKLSVRPRQVLGKKVNALRRKGLLPGVVYGGRADSTPVETDSTRSSFPTGAGATPRSCR